jgi:hypothetical protein
MRPPRPVIARKVVLTLLTERSDLARLPFGFNQSAARTLANLAGFLSAASSPRRPRLRPRTPPQPRTPCLCARELAARSPAPPRHRSRTTAVCRRSTCHHARAPPSRAHAL